MDTGRNSFCRLVTGMRDYQKSNIESKSISVYFLLKILLFQREIAEHKHERGQGQREKQTACRAGSRCGDGCQDRLEQKLDA